MVSVASLTTGLFFIIHMRCPPNERSFYFKIFTSFLLTIFLSHELAVFINRYVLFPPSRIVKLVYSSLLRPGLGSLWHACLADILATWNLLLFQVYPTKFVTLLYMYIYIYIERERDRERCVMCLFNS
jgi:hypothetical protein